MATDSIVNVEEKSPRSFGLQGRLVRLALVLAAVGLVAIPLSVFAGMVGYQMAGLAWLVCVISSLVAHIAGEYPSGDDNFATRLALSMVVRSGPPFLLVIAAKLVPSVPFGLGLVLLVVLFYIVGLIVDVSMQAARLKRSESSRD